MVHRKARLFAMLLVSLVPVRALFAQNLLSNPNFDTGLTGWVPNADLSWDSTLDVNNSPSSGSAKTSNNTQGCSGLLPYQACIGPITPGALYTFGGSVFSPVGQGFTNSAFVEVTWYTGAACGTKISPAQDSPAIFSKGTEGTWNQTAATVAAPLGAGSATLFGWTCDFTGGFPGTEQVNFDNMFFQETSIAAVPAVGAGGLLALGLLLAVAGLIAVGRR